MKNALFLTAMTTIASFFGTMQASENAPTCTSQPGMTYVKIGGGFPELINGGVGYRYFFTERQGIDASIEGSILPTVIDKKPHLVAYTLGANLHYIAKPFCQKAWYVGIGGMYRFVNIRTLGAHGHLGGPNFLLGREFLLRNRNKLFLQAEAGAFIGPYKALPQGKLTLGYGF